MHNILSNLRQNSALRKISAISKICDSSKLPRLPASAMERADFRNARNYFHKNFSHFDYPYIFLFSLGTQCSLQPHPSRVMFVGA
jgi:hypothetical protein